MKITDDAGDALPWDPRRYLTFGAERTRPAIDLLSRVPLDRPARVVDLGCGPGNSTALLRERWPDAEITGIDGSEEMLAEARRQTGIRWERADIARWRPGARYDVIFSNATLQWLDDHRALFPSLVAALAPGGVLITASCSHHVGRAEFEHMLRAAAADSGRRVLIREWLPQGSDHPELLTAPETGYLKGAVLVVE